MIYFFIGLVAGIVGEFQFERALDKLEEEKEKEKIKKWN